MMEYECFDFTPFRILVLTIKCHYMNKTVNLNEK